MTRMSLEDRKNTLIHRYRASVFSWHEFCKRELDAAVSDALAEQDALHADKKEQAVLEAVAANDALWKQHYERAAKEAARQQEASVRYAYEECLDLCREPVYSSTVADLIKEAMNRAQTSIVTEPGPVDTRIQVAVREAVEAEREACAKILDNGHHLHDQAPTKIWANQVAALIRARSSLVTDPEPADADPPPLCSTCGRDHGETLVGAWPEPSCDGHAPGCRRCGDPCRFPMVICDRCAQERTAEIVGKAELANGVHPIKIAGVEGFLLHNWHMGAK